jgi:outer membrane protein insertion porin family
MFKIFIILFLSLISFSSKAEIVESINITGNKRISDATIIIYGDIQIRKDYSESDLNKILNNLYSTNFFDNISIELSNNILRINLIELPTVSQLIILGEKKQRFLKDIKILMQLKENDYYSKSKLTKDIEIIKQLYSSIGYNFTEVTSKIKKINDGSIDLILEINKGQITKISKINFIGDKKIREKRLRDIIASEEDKFWKIISNNSKYSENLINLDKRLLTNYYKSIGYYDIKITSSSAEIAKSGEIDITYSIEAGNRYIFNKISTNTDQVFNKDIFYPLNNEYKKIIGTYYSPFKIKKLLDRVDELIENNNLQFVEHNVKETIDGDNISVTFNIFEGKRILIERINILGNNVTNESVIRSELIVDEGDPMTNLALDKSIANLKSRNLFKSVEHKIKNGSSSDLKIIDITVEEKATGEISAGAGLGTNGGLIAFSLIENNYLGKGNSVGFDFNLSKNSIKGTLNYTNPNYDFLGNSINYYVSSSSNDKPNQGWENSLASAGIGTSFEQYKDLFASLGLAASYDDLRTTDDASASLKKQSGSYSEISGNYSFTYDKRDRRFMPTDGYITSFRQSLPLVADSAFLSNRFTASTYKAVSENIIGAGKLYLSSIHGLGDDDVRLSKRISMPSTRLRGFESGKLGPVDGTDYVGGNYAAALNFEASLPKLLPESTKTDVGLFFDVGNVWGVDYDATIDDSNKVRASTGVAASWISPLGPMTFILSTNISKAATDETESFNFNLGTTF